MLSASMSRVHSRIPYVATGLAARSYLPSQCSTCVRRATPARVQQTCLAATRSSSSMGRYPPTKLPLQRHPTHRILKESPAASTSEKSAPYRPFKPFLIISLTFASVAGLYIMFVGVSWSNDISKHAEEKGVLPQDSDVTERWRRLGRDYDDEVEFSEKLFGTNIKKRRRKLAEFAYGKVLEVSAGTGRNFEYYELEPFDPTRPMVRNLIRSLTINDQSGIMLGIAEDKLEKQQDEAHHRFPGRVDFIVGDAGVRGIIPRPPGGYDTIVETMGLCSMVDPVGFLRTMGTLCRQPGEQSDTTKMQAGTDDGKGGRILLLEHGRSHLDIVNKILDSGASMHADHYGCWWNKDIAKIIQQSGLEVEKIRRYHFGTTWEIHLRPKSKV